MANTDLTFSTFTGADAALLLDALPDPLLLVGPPGSAGQVRLNAAAQERLGTVATGLESWPALLSLFLPETAQALQDAVQRVLRPGPGEGSEAAEGVEESGEGGVVRLSVRLRGAVAPALATVTPAGAGAALIHLREAREPLEVALELMDDMGMGVTVQGQDSRILHANQAAQRILGLSLEQLTGRDSIDPRWQAIRADGTPFPGEDHPAVQALRSAEAQRHVQMGVFHPPSGEWRWLDVSALPRRAPGATSPEQVTTVFAEVTAHHQAQQRLRQSERRFRSLVEATAQIVWDARPDGTFLPPQPGWEAFTGQIPQQYGEGGWLDAVHPEDRAHTLAAWHRALAAQDTYATHHRLRRQDGLYVPMQVRAVPVRDEQGRVLEYIGTHTDVTAVRQAEQALRDLNTELEDRVRARTQELRRATRFTSLLLSAAGEGIFGVNRQGQVTFVNPAAARLLGYGLERMIGADKHELIHHHHADGTPYRREDSPVFQTLHDGQSRRVDSEVLWHAQGHPIPVEYVVTPLLEDDGQVTGAVVMLQDITQRRQAQARLEKTIAELERSNQDLEQFAYVASHDLQEPLRTLGSYTELLARRYQGQLDARADQYLAFTQDAVERMRSLIQDLLGFARVGRSDRPRQRLTLERLMQASAQNVQASLEASGGSLEWDTPHAVMGQESLITQLLTNLLGNSLKFVPAGTAPRVRVRSSAQGEFVQVSVQDNGLGIAPEYHARVFDIFQRLHQRGTYSGNGMGLAICRKIVEHHGGTLWLESAPGQGSTFFFTLPAAPPELPL